MAAATYWPIVLPCMIDDADLEQSVKWMIDKGNSEKSWSCTALSIINPTWVGPISNPDRRGRKSTTLKYVLHGWENFGNKVLKIERLENVKNSYFWDVTPYGSCKNRCFGETYWLHHQSDKNGRDKNVSSVLRLLATANVVPTSLLPFALMEAIRSSATSVLTRSTRRNFPQDGILHIIRRENLR
jgi:hypothetical protein